MYFFLTVCILFSVIMDLRSKRSLIRVGGIWLLFYMCFRLSSILGTASKSVCGISELKQNVQRNCISQWLDAETKENITNSGSINVLPGFQKVDYAQDLWIYSVFYEYMNPASQSPGLRAIGLTSVNQTSFDTTECPTFHLTFPDGKTMSVRGREEKLRFDGRWSEENVEYANIVLECDLPCGIQPKYVSFSWPNNSTWSKNFEVTYPNLSRRRNLTMCYGVLHGYFSDYDAILQNIEYNRMMGVEHFYIYNQSVSVGVEAVLQFYIRHGILSVLQMPNEIPAKGSWYHGQQVSIQDCHTRNRYISTYVIVQDTDEFIMPLQNSSFTEVLEFVENNLKDLLGKRQMESHAFMASSFPEMLDFFDKYTIDLFGKKRIESDVFEVYPKEKKWPTSPLSVHEEIAGFSFQHAYFSRHPATGTELKRAKETFGMTEEDLKFADDAGVRIIKETRHAQFHDFPERQKMIFRPDLVILPGTHNTWWRKTNTVELRVSHSVAFLAHHSMKNVDVQAELYLHPQPFYKKYLDILKRTRAECLKMFPNITRTTPS